MTDVPKILIADDEEACIDFVREALADLPYEVLAARDGEEAVRMAREVRPDLIILDVQMPKQDGFQAFAQIRQDKDVGGTPVIMLTALSARTGVNISGRDLGDFVGSEPEAYIDKPIEPIVLQQAVKRLIGGSGAQA